MEKVTIETESGVFESNTSEVVVNLLPNTVHQLTVQAKVEKVFSFESCEFGDYSLTTKNDVNGDPLIIAQESP